MIIDTHTHTNFDAFKDDYREVIDRALGENVWLINVGSDLATSKRAVEIAGEYKEGVYAAIGLHPTDAEKEIFDEKALSGLAQNEKVVAIGECGLDFFRTKDEFEKQKQKELFIKHIELSQKVGKPLIIHCRDAHDDLFKILEPRTYNLESAPGVMHFFTGTLEQAKKYIDLGFYISFSGVITFAKEYDILVKELPMDRILIETDAPYVSPAPMRGKRNEPSYVKYVAQKIADLKGISAGEVERQTTENAGRLFKLSSFKS